MNKMVLVVVISFISANCFAGKKYKLQDLVFKNSRLPFLDHRGEGPFSTYLSMEIQFSPIAALFKELIINKRFQLKNRGEAHITVITPVEFYNVLKGKMTIDEINKIALNSNLQNSTFEIVCLGRGQATIKKKLEKTFYVVVKSENLIQIRRKVQKLFISRGGDKKLFKPSHYYPHITLGFTKRDLHESDGIIKNKNSCIAKIELINTKS